MELRIYVANLGKYNEGILQGEWFTLPVDIDEMKEAIGINEQYEEWAIHDYELPFEIGEYESIEKLNEIAEELGNIDGLNELLEILNGNDKYDNEMLGSTAINVFSEIDVDHDIIDDEAVDEIVKNSDRGTGLKFFFMHCNPSHEYHLLDGYENLEELNHAYVSNVLSDYFMGLLN